MVAFRPIIRQTCGMDFVSNAFPGYRITRQLGVGAGSKISLATELKTGKQYAVKHVVRNSAEDDPFIRQMENEYAISSKLTHPYLRHSYHLLRSRKLLQLKELLLVMDYCSRLFKRETVESFFKNFREITAAVLENPGILLQDIEISTEARKAEPAVSRVDLGFN